VPSAPVNSVQKYRDSRGAPGPCLFAPEADCPPGRRFDFASGELQDDPQAEERIREIAVFATQWKSPTVYVIGHDDSALRVAAALREEGLSMSAVVWELRPSSPEHPLANNAVTVYVKVPKRIDSEDRRSERPHLTSPPGNAQSRH
jgi:hypothetical protein